MISSEKSAKSSDGVEVMPPRHETLTPEQQFEKDFFNKPWEQMTGTPVLGMEYLLTPEEKSKGEGLLERLLAYYSIKSR